MRLCPLPVELDELLLCQLHIPVQASHLFHAVLPTPRSCLGLLSRHQATVVLLPILLSLTPPLHTPTLLPRRPTTEAFLLRLGCRYAVKLPLEDDAWRFTSSLFSEVCQPSSIRYIISEPRQLLRSLIIYSILSPQLPIHRSPRGRSPNKARFSTRCSTFRFYFKPSLGFL